MAPPNLADQVASRLCTPLDQVGRLGRAAGIIGYVRDDDFGWLNIDRRRRDGVDTSAIASLADAVTGSAFVTYTEKGERRRFLGGQATLFLLQQPVEHLSKEILVELPIQDALVVDRSTS